MAGATQKSAGALERSITPCRLAINWPAAAAEGAEGAGEDLWEIWEEGAGSTIPSAARAGS